jgi:hypothetical protein
MAKDICDTCNKRSFTSKYTDADGNILDLCETCYMLHDLNDKVTNLTGMVAEIVKDKV